MLTKSRILIVEDNAIAARVLTNYCQKRGLVVDHAPGAAIATALLEEKHYALIFMDVGLADGDGKDLTQWIREGEGLNQVTPIIVVSAHVDEALKEACLAVGATEVLTKPIRHDRMEVLLQALLKEVS